MSKTKPLTACTGYKVYHKDGGKWLLIEEVKTYKKATDLVPSGKKRKSWKIRPQFIRLRNKSGRKS